MYCFFDFEYKESQNQFLNVVCVAWQLSTGESGKVWLLEDNDSKKKFKQFIEDLASKGYIFVAFNVVAEGRSLLALGIDIMDLQWLDLQAEYKMAINSNWSLAYGPQLTKQNTIIETKHPSLKYSMSLSAQNMSRFDKPNVNLLAVIFKILGVQIDNGHKTDMRDLILEKDKFYTPEEKMEILEYCESDIKYLPKILDFFLENDVDVEEALYRGKAVAIHAVMENNGYPLDREAAENFTESRDAILNEVCRDINANFPEITPFRYVKTTKKFSVDTKKVKEWVESTQLPWERTATGAYSLSLESFQKNFDPRHSFRSDCFGEQYVRFLKTRQALNGFQETKSGSFWDYVGNDDRVRCYLGPYNSQSARSQPKAKGHVFLKTAHVRVLCQPKAGRLMGTIDYGSVEFLISALKSKCPSMIDAYKSGDVYLHFGKAIGLIPPNGTKASHKLQRDMCKKAILGISYGLTKVGLNKELEKLLNGDSTEEYAQELIDSFFEVYSEYKDFRSDILESYYDNGYLKLDDGWYLWGDNPNERSITNFISQGQGSVILRRALLKAHEAGLFLCFPLHDAIYIEFDENDLSAMDTLYKCMKSAFVECFPGQEEDASLITLDGKVWGPKFTNNCKVELKQFTVEASNKHIDERAISEYERLKKYLVKKSNVEI